MKKTSLILILLALSTLLFAEKITFSADSMTGSTSKNSERTRLTGNAKITTDTIEISADSIELSGKDFRHIQASGNVTGTNKSTGMDFTCGQLTYDRETQNVTLQNAVHLVDRQNNVTADAELITFNQNTQIAVMQISVTLRQDTSICTAAYAIYKKNEQQLKMSGNPQVQQGQDVFRAQEIELDLNTKEITLDGRVKGSITASQEKKQ